MCTECREYPSVWEVFDGSIGRVYATNDDTLVKCIPTEDCFKFSIHHGPEHNDAVWTLEYDGKFIAEGGRIPGGSDSATFGPHCT